MQEDIEMTALLEIKQNIKRFYGQYEVYILAGSVSLFWLFALFSLDQQQ